MNTESQSVATANPQKTYGRHRCAECGEMFTSTHNRQTTFCCTTHKVAFQDRERVRGRAMVKLAQAWRLGRNTKDPAKKAVANFAFEELAALADVYNQEDVAAGRPNALFYTGMIKASGVRPSVDRGR